MKSKCSVQDGDLIINDDDGTLVWRGKPGGLPLERALPIPSSQDCIVMVSDEVSRPWGMFENLMRVNSKGDIIWKSSPIDTTPGAPYGTTVGSSYLDYSLKDGRLYGYTGRGFLVEMDLETGRLLSKEFIK